MKMIAAVPFALLTLGVLGCAQQASTAPAVQQPAAAAPAGETNMFGENKDDAAGNAANARAAAYSSDHGTATDASSATTSAAAGSTPPK